MKQSIRRQPARFNAPRDRLWRVCLLAVLSASIASSAGHAPRAGAARASIAATVLVLDESIRALSDTVADARAILHAIAPRLPADANPVAASIEHFLRRIPPRGSTDFACGEDFVRNRARQELTRIRETVLGSPPTDVTPQFCYTTPYAIDASRPPSTVEFYGFDFDAATVEMFLISDNDFKDVSGALEHHSHYHVTLRIGGVHGVKLAADSRSLGLTWGHLIAHAVPIVRENTRVCPTAVEEIPKDKEISLEPPPLPGQSPHTTLPPRALLAQVTLDVQSNAVIATVCAVANAPHGGSTIYSGCANEYVATLDPDRRIERILGPLETQLAVSLTGNAADSVVAGQSGFVRRWVVGRLSPRPGTGRPMSITAVLSALRVVVTVSEHCISAIEFGEARTAGALGQAAVRSLDRQLSSIDPSVVRLRPRFAPSNVPRIATTK